MKIDQTNLNKFVMFTLNFDSQYIHVHVRYWPLYIPRTNLFMKKKKKSFLDYIDYFRIDRCPNELKGGLCVVT